MLAGFDTRRVSQDRLCVFRDPANSCPLRAFVVRRLEPSRIHLLADILLTRAMGP